MWADHASFMLSKWRDIEEYSKDDVEFLIESFGYIVKEDEQYIVLSPHICFEWGQTTGEIRILKSCIKEKVLVIDKKKGKKAQYKNKTKR